MMRLIEFTEFLEIQIEETPVGEPSLGFLLRLFLVFGGVGLFVIEL
jgi:hypothetical protein